MRNILTGILIISVVALCACKKTQLTTINGHVIHDTLYLDTTVVSQSFYTGGTISFGTYIAVHRDSINTTQIVYEWGASAKFAGQGPDHRPRVYIDDQELGFEDDPSSPGYNTYYVNKFLTETELAAYDSARLKIYSFNGAIDLNFRFKVAPTFHDFIPYFIDGNMPYTIHVNDADFPGADSLRIVFDQGNGIDTTVSIYCGSVSFSQSSMHSLYPSYAGQIGRVGIIGIRHYIIKRNDRTFNLTNTSGISTDVKVVF